MYWVLLYVVLIGILSVGAWKLARIKEDAHMEH